jgi:hypothetical protein
LRKKAVEAKLGAWKNWKSRLKYWLWVAAAEFLSVFYLAKSRSRDSFNALVGKEKSTGGLSPVTVTVLMVLWRRIASILLGAFVKRKRRRT